VADTPDCTGLVVSEEDGRIRLAVPATLGCIDLAVEAAISYLTRRTGRGCFFGVTTTLREALLNAVTHGCRQSPGSFVECSLDIQGQEAVIVVSDPGQGFDWKTKSPCAPGPDSTSGRGLCIMNFYANSVVYNEAGNTLRIRVDLA